MLLNLNNCSVLKPQGYSSLQSISETQRYELKNILTFAFCWVEKLVLFFWTSPGYRVCWKGQGFGLVNQKVSSSLSVTEISPFPVPPNQSHGSKAHSHLPHVQMQDCFSAIPHVPDKGLCLFPWGAFFSQLEGRAGTSQQKPGSLVSLVWAHSGSSGTFWGTFCRQRWHGKTGIWSWTQQKSWKDHLNPSQHPCHKLMKIFYSSWWRAMV